MNTSSQADFSQLAQPLICSALTPPPQLTEQCEWDFSKIDKSNLTVSATLFRTILEATWANFRTSEKTCAQLAEAGFEKIEIFWDSRRMFPTFCAQKYYDNFPDYINK